MDILNNSKFQKGTNNSASTEGAAAAAPDKSANPATTSTEVARGTDMISQMNSKGSAQPAATVETKPSADATTSQGTTSGSEGNDWTTDSALKEIKKLREENKQYRLKYSEQLDKLKQEADARLAQKEEEARALAEKAKELDRIKEEQEDKKRDLAERLAVRESKLSEMQTLMKVREEELQKKLAEKEKILSQFEADRAAESQVYQNRLDEELVKIPEKYRELANLLVKGSGDPRDALVALNEAKLKGMFEDKTVVVNHQVPGASDGARSSQERLREGERQTRASMSSNQKIKTALEQIKGGTPNNAFRTK